MTIRTNRRHRAALASLAALALAGGAAAASLPSATASENEPWHVVLPTGGVEVPTGDLVSDEDGPFVDDTLEHGDLADASVVEVSLDEDGTLRVNGVVVDPENPPADLPFTVHVDDDTIEVHAEG